MQIFLEEEKEKEEAEGENPKENKPEKNLLQSTSMAREFCQQIPNVLNSINIADS